MAKLNTQDASFLMLESPDSPMHIGFMLTFKLPKGAPADYMQKLHAKLERFAVDVEPFNLRLAQKEGFGKLAPEWEVDGKIDLGYHLRHEALPWPGGERELGLVISRLHSLPLERSRPLWECTLIEGLQPDRFAIYMKIHHSLVDGVGLMQRLTHILAESPRGLSLPPWSAPNVTTDAPPKPTQSTDEEWRRLFEGLLAGLGKSKPKGDERRRPAGCRAAHVASSTASPPAAGASRPRSWNSAASRPSPRPPRRPSTTSCWRFAPVR